MRVGSFIEPKRLRPLSSSRGKQAVVIGLIGYDNEHGARDTGARVELHPVWGLAIKDDSNPDDITWAIFARNWGNEGFCSNGFDVTKGEWQHYLALRDNKMTLFLPTSIGRTSKIDPQFKSDYGDGNSKATASIVDDGVLLTIQLPTPVNRNLFWGELHVRRK